MKTKVVTFMLLLHLVVASTVKTEMCTCPDGDIHVYAPNPACFREALQAELTSTPTNIQQLQNVFYSSNNLQRFYIYTDMTVNITCQTSEFTPKCNSSTIIYQFSWTHIWYEDTFTGVTRKLITEKLFHQNLVAIFLWTPQLSAIGSQVQSAGSLSIQSNCVSRGKPNQVKIERGMREIWEGILQWSKAYARAGGPVPAPSDSDKGQVSCTFCYMQSDSDKGQVSCSIQSDVDLSLICLAFHIIVNLVVGVILVVLVPSQIIKQKVSSATSSLLWSSAIIGAPFAFTFIAAQLEFTILTYFAAAVLPNDEVVYASISVLLFFLLTIELIVAIFRSKRSVLAVPRCVGYCCSFCCFCCFCCCCRPGGRSHSRVARSLALWFFMAWLQLIAASVVPVTITVLTTSPLLALAGIAMVVSTFFGTVVFLAVLVHMCSQHDHSKQCILFTYSVIFFGVLVMVCLAIFLFLEIIVHGGQVNSIAGFIGTLVPSAILSIMTLFVKAKVFGKKPTEADHSCERPEEVQDETTRLLEDV